MPKGKGKGGGPAEKEILKGISGVFGRKGEGELVGSCSACAEMDRWGGGGRSAHVSWYCTAYQVVQ